MKKKYFFVMVLLAVCVLPAFSQDVTRNIQLLHYSFNGNDYTAGFQQNNVTFTFAVSGGGTSYETIDIFYAAPNQGAWDKWEFKSRSGNRFDLVRFTEAGGSASRQVYSFGGDDNFAIKTMYPTYIEWNISYYIYGQSVRAIIRLLRPR